MVGTVGVFEAARSHGLRRVAYASSVAAHGAAADSPYLATLYGAYKACDEAMARVYAKDWDVPSVGIRPGVVYGVGRDQGMTSKTTEAILAAALGKEYEVPFRGTVSYLYAGEIASAFVRAVSRDGDGAPVFDCNGSIATVEEGLDTLRRLVPEAHVRASGDPLPFPAEGRATPGSAHTSATTAQSPSKRGPPRPLEPLRSCCGTGSCRTRSETARSSSDVRVGSVAYPKICSHHAKGP